MFAYWGGKPIIIPLMTHKSPECKYSTNLGQGKLHSPMGCRVIIEQKQTLRDRLKFDPSFWVKVLKFLSIRNHIKACKITL